MSLDYLGIVVLNYNSFSLTTQCIDSILKYYRERIKIVIVDNQSNDQSFKLLNENYAGWPNIHILQTEYNGGYSYGNNVGMRYLIQNYDEIEYLAIINPDVVIMSNDIFETLLKRLEQDDRLAGISPLMMIGNKLKPNRWAIKNPKYIYHFISSFVFLTPVDPLLYRSYETDTESLVAYVDVIPGSFFIMKKDIFVQIGLLDENNFLYGEEIIIGKKIKDEEYKLGLSFEEFYIHHHNSTCDSLIANFSQLKFSIRSHLYFNRFYQNKFWGIIDSLLLILFMPLKVLEIIIIYCIKRSKVSK
ncbi:MAG: hypothetical protein AMS27_09140 [Bacteroides sp. SM23_62_1]|nr:MAG: hypothetical protein AMS27_09140 [Bacteroides sp. SM23_62_1]